MTITLPDPPLDADGDLRVHYWTIRTALAVGLVGGCSVCQGSTVTWWDLAACDMEPVADGNGSLTDYVPLHERCIDAVLAYWASLLHHGDPGEEDADEPFAGVASPPSHQRVARRSPRGAYARQAAGGA